VPWTEFEKRFTTNPVRASLARAGITNPFHLASYMRGSGAAIADLVKDATLLNTDDNVWLEHRMPRDMVKVIPSNTSESVSRTLASLGTARYLATLRETLPGLSLQDAVGRTLEYLFVREPAILPGGVVVDVSLRTRIAQTAAMRREIEAMGDSHLLIAFDAHHERRQRDLDNRMQAARLLARPLAQGRVPDFETAGQASGLAPDLPQATLLVANHLFQRRQLAEAEAYYRRLSDNPAIAGYDALVGLGNIAVLRGQFDEANAILERAIARNPYLPNAYTTLAILYRGRNDTARARDTLVRALRLNPGEPDLESRLRSLDPVR
jgi:tetratricopeptide (TPR) repeat protein